MLGVCERQSGSFEAAVDLLRHALLLDPRCAPALSELGLALEALQRHDEALACFDRLINLKPDFIEAHYNRGNVLLASGRLEQAVASFDDMIRLDPNHVSAWNNRGNALSRLDKLEQAVASYDKALSLKPKHVSALVNRGSVLLKRADVEAAIASYDRSLAVKPDDENTLSNRIFALDFLARSDFASHQAARSQWWDRIGAKIAAERVVQHDNDFNPDKRITLGYVSADFRRHSAAYIFRPVLQCHDRSCFEVICYNNTVAEDDVTFAFRNLANRWRDIQQWSDDQLAECIRTDKVDILIDLSGHTGGNRLRVFALKPAPVQVTAWGHATGTGLPTIDYLFADPVLIPPEVRPLFAEQIYDLPCVIAIEPPSAEFRSSQPPVVNNGFLTFGVFNRVSKISDAAIATWSGIMHSLSSAQLLIKDHTLSDSSVQNLLREKFACHGVAPDRLRLIGATSREQHLAAYGQVDMCLDPFPHGGGVSTWEALHMGVPVVAKLGNTMPERLSGAILSAIGLTDWVADDDDEYVEIALRAEPDQLSMLRRELPDIIASRCGPVPYTRAVENAFRAMWRKCCEAKEALV
jgi:predicted O-linked N-acetylglucosamine transferase (SPINDLY family)